MMKKIKKILTGEVKIKDVYHYLLGNYRYKLYYSKKFYWLIRKHIFEQIEYRIKWMDRDCYNNGSCKMCGCETTHLQMANKSCDKPCYPPIMNRADWEEFKRDGVYTEQSGRFWVFKNLGRNKRSYYD